MSVTGRGVALVGWGVVVFAAAGVGTRFTPGAWYAALQKPSWNPPNWIFGPVWTVLYLLMAIAAWRVSCRSSGRVRRVALGWFVVQLALNTAWSPLFFGWHRTGLAFAELVLLWMAIVATGRAFLAVDRVSAWMLAPYLAWVTFAGVLNFTLWRMNP